MKNTACSLLDSECTWLYTYLYFEGGGSFSGLLQTIGGKMTEEAFELVLKKFDLDVSMLVE